MKNTERQLDRRVHVCVVGIALLAYATSLFGVFVYDDIHSVRDNPAIRSLAAIPSFFWDTDAFSSLAMRMYRPVVLTTLAIDHFIGGGAVWAFKAGNVFVHAANALLLVSLLRALGIARGPVLAACGLFAAHPLASEAVNMVSSRSDLLNGFGLLLTMRAYLALLHVDGGGRSHGGRLAMGGVLLGTVIACGSKATGVVAPVLCAVLEFTRWIRERDRAGQPFVRAALRLAPVCVLVLGYLLVRRECLGMATLKIPQLSNGSDVLNGAGRDLVTQFALMGYVLPKFLAQSLLPVGLTLDPWVPLHDRWWSAPVLAGWAFVGSITVLGLRAPRRRPVHFLGTSLAWCAAAPWVLVPLNLPACEHRFYVPLAALACVLAASLPARWFERQPAVSRRRSEQAVGAVLLLVGSTFAVGSSARSLDYRDADTLWSQALHGYPRSIRSLCGLATERRADAMAARLRGDTDVETRQLHHALALLDRAVEIYPEHRAARRNIAEFELALGPLAGDGERALEMADWLLSREPDNPFYRLLRSRVLIFLERYDDAVETALGVLEIAEPKGLVYRTAASARLCQGDLPAAIELLDRSVARGLDHESVLLQRADYLLRQHRVVAAEQDVQTVLARDPFHGDALRLLQRIRTGSVGSAKPGR